ncbi:MAG: FadR/GntR family transcriptional regulator [Cypionkella sp.]
MTRLKSGDIAASLRDRVLGGEWAETKVVPNERALSVEYGVARNTIRRAVETLVEEGLVTRHVGRGTLIAQPSPPAKAPDGAKDLVQIVRNLAGTSPLDIMNMRLIIEPQAAAAAAANASATELEAIAQAHDIACETTDKTGFEHWDMQFHQRIFTATRNDLLRNLNEILAIIRTQPRIFQIRRRGFTEAGRLETCRQHQAIVAALNARDTEAAADAMRKHLLVRSQTLFGASNL